MRFSRPATQHLPLDQCQVGLLALVPRITTTPKAVMVYCLAMNVRDKVVIVTGASAGIGLAIARLMEVETC